MMHWRARLAAAIAAISLAVVVPATTASAVEVEQLCTGVPSAGFLDVDPSNVHARDIDCLAWWEITGGTSPSTYSPAAPVTRWQMAVFIGRITSWQLSVPDPGFLDTSHISAEAKASIGLAHALGIASGTSATTFDPDAPVTRWQMALFLTRYLHAEGVVLPAGTEHGFVDVGHLPTDTRTAINQLAAMGITSGTSRTTFDPERVVTREQMASFLIRSFATAFSIGLHSTEECTPPIDPVGLPEQGTVCTADVLLPAGTTLVLRHGWVHDRSGDPTAQPVLAGVGTRIELLVDGQPQVVHDRHLLLPGVELPVFSHEVRGGLTGIHAIDIRWYRDGVLVHTDIVTAEFI